MDRPVVGIICEYDPFHRGHAHQFALIRRQLPDALILCLMSGCFTQRGMPAMHQPRARAEAALRAGADLSEVKVRFLVRWSSAPLDRKMIVRYAGEEYEIEFINDYNDSHEFVELWCTKTTTAR